MMSRYQVYATRWNDPAPLEQVPTSGLEFTLPLSDHGECSFSATVEPGRSFWRPSLSADVSGVLVCRDDQPVWSGRLWTEPPQTGPRTFQFTCAEWGSFYERVPAVAKTYSAQNDHLIFRDLIAQAAFDVSQDIGLIMGTSLGASYSDLTINPWDDTTVETQFRQLGDAQGGPEWYFNTAGTMEAPKRVLVLGDRLGGIDPVAALEYVENTEAWTAPEAPPEPTALGNLFPGPAPYAVIGGRRGGNVIAHPGRGQDASGSATATIAIGSGDQASQMRSYAVAEDLIAAGQPRQTITRSYPDVKNQGTLDRHAAADLAAARGMVTTYTLTTFETDPDWTQIQRGDVVRVELDTDAYGTERPLIFESRVLEMAVAVQNDGPAQVNYHLADVRSS